MEIRQFPLKTQIGVYQAEQDLFEFLAVREESVVLAYDYGLINHSSFIYTPEIIDIFARYKMLRSHNIISFGNTFDDLPAVWIDVVALIDNEIEKALEEKRIRDGQIKG